MTTGSPLPMPHSLGARAISVDVPSAAGDRSESDSRQVPHPLAEPPGFCIPMR